MSTSSNRLRESDHQREITHVDGRVVDASENLQKSAKISAVEAEELRQEKLSAIRKAIEAGAYDSDEMLDKALKRMLDSMDNEP